MTVKSIKSITSLFLCLVGTTVSGYSQQKEMTLEECLKYAKENSITLKQSKLQIEDRLSDQLRAKGVFLPSVSASISQGLGSNPLSDDASNYYSGSYGIDLAMPIYSGGTNRANLKQSAINTEIAELTFAEQVNSMEVAVTETFVQILYAMEQIEVSKKSLEISEKTLEQGKAYLEVGSINEADYALLESAKADSEYDVILAETTLSNLQVSLKHLLEISQDVKIAAVAPDLSSDAIMTKISSVSEVYDAAVEIRPEIEASNLAIAIAELDETIAKAGYLPTVSLTAGAGVSHNSSSSFTFSDQVRDNFSTTIGAKVSVPIFSNYENKTSVSKARNATTSASLSLVDAKKILYQTIETLHNNAQNAQAKYAVSKYKLTATEKSLELITEQYNEGLKNIIELLSEQDSFLTSSQDYLTNKYQFILNRALLEYYKTGLIKL